MIISRITGGLGNQMFQYAFGRRLAVKHETELKLDVSFYSDPANAEPNPVRTYDLGVFKIHERIASQSEIAKLSKRVENDLIDRVLNRLKGVKQGHIREPHFHFSESAYNSPNNIYLSGYWQSEKYFADIEPTLRAEFEFNDQPDEMATAMLDRIESTNSVCVHVRRGDFLTNPLNGLFGVDYIQKAEEIMMARISDPTYFVFSDDMDWCEASLKFEGSTVFVSNDFGGMKFRDDLRLMAACKHFIISNSSFSWWAVWLSRRDDKIVVAPKEWFRDKSLDTRNLIPLAWIRI